MGIKGLCTILILHASLFAMEGQKPVLQRAYSEFKNLVSSSKSESSLPEFSLVSSQSSSEPLLTRSTSSTLFDEDALRISNILLQYGVDSINQYDRAQYAILEKNKADFLDALDKIPTQELKDALNLQWITLCEEGPYNKYSTSARPANDALLEIAIIQAAQEIWKEIDEYRKLQKKIVPYLDLAIIRSLEDISKSSTSDKSSQKKSDVIHTYIPLKPSANTIKSSIINEGSILKCSNMKKEKDKKTASP